MFNNVMPAMPIINTSYPTRAMLASDLGDRGPFKAMKKKLANN